MEVDGNLLRRLREDSGLSVLVLANRAQITKGYLSMLENGQRSNPSPMVMARLAAALDCSIADLRPVTSRPRLGRPKPGPASPYNVEL